MGPWEAFSWNQGHPIPTPRKGGDGVAVTQLARSQGGRGAGDLGGGGAAAAIFQPCNPSSPLGDGMSGMKEMGQQGRWSLERSPRGLDLCHLHKALRTS